MAYAQNHFPLGFLSLGPSLTYGLKSLQFIQELSHVVLQLIHNIVGSEP